MKTLSVTILLLFLTISSLAQNSYPFKITLEPMITTGFTGLQSYAWAKDGDMVLLIGGRTDGLHRRQPFAAFNKQYNNTEMIVLDLKQEKIWKKSILTLPTKLAEQLQSTNMEFYQQGNQLTLIGGYGFSENKRTHLTYPSLICLKVKEIINAVIINRDMAPFIHQLEDERMAVTGGRLNKLNNLFYLVGGQRFDGRYNPHGPDHGPGFSQQYTNQIRKFSLAEKDGQLSIENYSSVTDSQLLHRRDYNLLMQLDHDGKEMLSIYSGVFQYGKDIPFTTIIDITEKSHREIPGFHQLFSHYHTASIPVYNKETKTMYSVFFGGIAQNYIDSSGHTITDNDVPFVKTISVVERKDNTVKEYILSTEMPGYFGAAAEFIPADGELFTANGLLNLEKVSKNPLLVGYIAGGIDSRAPNVFWSNESDPSRASTVIWKVYFSIR
ncbi:MAG: T9SS C-terminal target domain-containing protein [Chitinophagaceae bacterium]|nr:T9SS C-terminal target domain-containing protein [Chitinophagaceae bacterium]